MENMDNNYYLQPDVRTYTEHQNQPYYQDELDLTPNPYLNSDTMMTAELEVDWDQWIEESAIATDETPFENSGVGSMSQPTGTKASLSVATLDVNWLDEELLRPIVSGGSPVLYELDEIENILFSSPESSHQTYTSTPDSSEAHTRSTSSEEPSPSSSTSTSTSPSRPPPVSQSSSSQEPVFACHFCPSTFPKRHFLNRHHRQHNPSIACPHAAQGCTHRTARNRDMARHIAVHHPSPAIDPVQVRQQHLCPVSRCVAAREGFTRRDNLVRHMRRVHGVKLGDG